MREAQSSSGQMIMISLSFTVQIDERSGLAEKGINYDMDLRRVKVLANGTEIAPDARFQLYVGGKVVMDLNAYAASLDCGQPLDVPEAIPRHDTIRARGNLPKGVAILLSGVGVDDFGEQHQDWVGSNPRPNTVI